MDYIPSLYIETLRTERFKTAIAWILSFGLFFFTLIIVVFSCFYRIGQIIESIGLSLSDTPIDPRGRPPAYSIENPITYFFLLFLIVVYVAAVIPLFRLWYAHSRKINEVRYLVKPAYLPLQFANLVKGRLDNLFWKLPAKHRLTLYWY
jgi:hypothetical protein